jgi:succinyl-diaminopimelate desuccinylase
MKDHLEHVVEGMKQEVIELLQKMVRIPSENPPANYAAITRFLSEELRKLGFEVQIFDATTVNSTLGEPGSKPNIIGTMHGTASGPVLIFNAHIDTVPAGTESAWAHGPFSAVIDDGRLYGRGATDSKARLVAYISAVVALKRLGLPMRGSVIIAATCDEETGGVLGAGYVAQNRFVQGDMVIVEGYSNQIVRAMAGVLQLRITVKGKAAHAGFKWNGMNAIEKMAALVSGLQGLQEMYQQRPSAIPGMRYTTVNVGVIRGGTKVNVVPGDCEIDVDFRVVPEQSLEEVYQDVLRVIETIQQDDPEFHASMEVLQDFNTPPTVMEEDSPLIDKLQNAQMTLGRERLPVVGMMGQTDGRWFLQQGIPTISFGPGRSDNHLHGYDEFVDLDDLLHTIKVLTIFVQGELCPTISTAHSV